MTKIKSITIKNPADGQKDLDKRSLSELVDNALFQMASFMKNELERPDKRAVWPRKWRVLLSNGKNQLAAAKIELQKFTDVRKNAKRLGQLLFGDNKGFTGIKVEEENGARHTLSLADEAVLFLDFGDITVKGKRKGSKAVAQ